MERSVNKINGLIVIFLVFLASKAICQDYQELEYEDHQKLASIFEKSSESRIIVYFETFEYESWMNLIWGKDFLNEDGIAFCNFEDPQLKQAFYALKDRLIDLEIKRFNKNHLENKFKLTKNSKKRDAISISESLVIGEYSFMFLKSETDKSLWVQKKDRSGNWRYECSVPLEYKLH